MSKDTNRYIDSLDDASRQRYMDKLKILNGKDPYQLPASEWSDDVELYPDIQYQDILNYLIFNPSPYTMENIGAWKSTEAYNQLVSGWIREIKCNVQNNLYLIAGKVLHSQKLNEKPLNPWIVAQKNGQIIAAHCNCMAGLGEACSHIAAVLFAIETAIRIRNSRTVTQERAYWKLPGKLKEPRYLDVTNIDFTSAKRKRLQLDNAIDEACTSRENMQVSNTRKTKEMTLPVEGDIKILFDKLSEAKSAILSVIPPYLSKFVPRPLTNAYPPLLNDLLTPSSFKMNFKELMSFCEKIDITVTPEQAYNVSQATKGQSKSNIWHRYRVGRITSSILKDACVTNITKPSVSLLKRICSVGKTLSTPAIDWGVKHEGVARNNYVEVMKMTHVNFSIQESGFVINPDYPHLGVSPDGIINCDCCGTGTLEIKCPYSLRHKMLCEASNKFYLKPEGKSFVLDRKHQYFYQVQGQMNVCDFDYADFVVWTEKDIHIERIEKDPTFWNEVCSKSKEFFQSCVLPELVAKFYSQSMTMRQK